MPAFALDSISLSQTRSLHSDTDYVCAGLVLDGFPSQPKILRIGNVNNGVESNKTYPVELEFPGIPAWETDDKFVFSYMVINHGGGSTDAVTAACKRVMTQSPLMVFDPVKATPDPKTGVPACLVDTLFAADDLVSWWNQIKDNFNGVPSDRCDGLVAIGRVCFFGSFLDQLLLEPREISMNHLGMDSAGGCGPNSHYSVQWSVKK